jgi:hypothetical protein
MGSSPKPLLEVSLTVKTRNVGYGWFEGRGFDRDFIVWDGPIRNWTDEETTRQKD